VKNVFFILHTFHFLHIIKQVIYVKYLKLDTYAILVFEKF